MNEVCSESKASITHQASMYIDNHEMSRDNVCAGTYQNGSNAFEGNDDHRANVRQTSTPCSRRASCLVQDHGSPKVAVTDSNNDQH